MSTIKNNSFFSKRRWYIIALLLIIGAIVAWYFFNIIIYIIVAAALSFIGQPLVALLDKIRIGKFKMPHTLSALLTLILLLGIGFGFLAIFIPMVINQIEAYSQMDIQQWQDGIQEPVMAVENWLHKHGLIPAGESLQDSVTQGLVSFLDLAQLPDMVNMLISLAGDIFIAVFAISFITFFFLKDKHMFNNGVILITPTEYIAKVQSILFNTRKLLSRYFLGLLLDLTIVISLISGSMYLLGFDNALIIGFFSGIMNVIPYIGPIIGASLGIMIGMSENLSADFYTEMLPLILQMIGVYVGINLLDAIFLQPTIYGKSVKAHPLEIFLMIMIAGSIAGIPGMILAIPSYTVIRIIAKEFLSRLRVVQKLTEKFEY